MSQPIGSSPLISIQQATKSSILTSSPLIRIESFTPSSSLSPPFLYIIDSQVDNPYQSLNQGPQKKPKSRKTKCLSKRSSSDSSLRGAGSREQGAGCREQGAGSREQGAGSREQGAGSVEQTAPFQPKIKQNPQYKNSKVPRSSNDLFAGMQAGRRKEIKNGKQGNVEIQIPDEMKGKQCNIENSDEGGYEREHGEQRERVRSLKKHKKKSLYPLIYQEAT